MEHKGGTEETKTKKMATIKGGTKRSRLSRELWGAITERRMKGRGNREKGGSRWGKKGRNSL